ncbi:Holliday junction branch migration protein RuvA [soil metagenome]
MIGRLSGILLEKQPPHLLIDVGGIGYELEASLTSCYRLPEVGAQLMIFTHMVVREDAHLLYGFATQDERSLFRSLIKVNGVGPKLALTILSSIEPEMFVRCIHDNDSTSLTRLPGIGKKTAERLLVEMRDRLSHWHETMPLSSTTTVKAATVPSHDAVHALISLGYSPQEANRAIAQIDAKNLTSEELIRLALKGMR